MYIDESLTATTLRFSWVIEQTIAASARPGRYGPLEEHLKYIKESGIRTIINLCEDPLNFPDGYRSHFEIIHVPILDGDAPTPEQLKLVFQTIDKVMNDHQRCLVHCRGGIGRTATVLAPVLVQYKGIGLHEALELLRQSGRRTETMQQFRFIEEWVASKL